MARVQLNQLVKDYRDGHKGIFRAVKSIDLDIRDHEFMVLVGPSGCGKSTTLRMIAGLEEISSGSILIDDKVVNDVLPKNRDIAMVFQNYALYPHMSIFENMAFGLKLMKYSKGEIKQRVEDAADILGLRPLLERKPKALSGGQRQRVAVGRAIVRQPKVFLFDEPLSNLDAKMRVQMRTEISKLHEKLDATMIYVTHDQVEAMTMGDRICVMKDGNIMQVADPLTLYNKPESKFVAGFIGSPPMNFFPGEISHQDGVTRFHASETTASPMHVIIDPKQNHDFSQLNGRKVILGVRPEDISEARDGQSPHLQATVELSEPMGAETYLHLRNGDQSFIARMDCSRRYQSGQCLSLCLKADKLHFFDPESALNLSINRSSS